jgi:hypothetical protein
VGPSSPCTPAPHPGRSTGYRARHPPDQSRRGAGRRRTNRHGTHQEGGPRLPQPGRPADHAAKQRAYRARQAQTRTAEQQTKGRPPAPPLPPIPARARWQALLTHARLARETVQLEMQTYGEERSETWQERERGMALAQDLEQLGTVLDELAVLTGTARSGCST